MLHALRDEIANAVPTLVENLEVDGDAELSQVRLDSARQFDGRAAGDAIIRGVNEEHGWCVGTDGNFRSGS